ncbi:fibronectin type III domain-containing protein [Candidatus Poriferisodalis sp.]|uniref:fibronectin type III domain-containing protein n=1 Tax=Candidatus Poriferisodalis sp. TaxID=3101277 RepID=UPI003B5A19BA
MRFAALAVLSCIVVGLLLSPAQAQAGSVPDKPRGLTAAASHDSVTLSWDDPGDDTVTGYVILRRIPAVDRRGHFDELVPDTASTATTYTDHTVSASTRYTYRIKAINEYGVSERSRWYHINTPAAPAPDKPRGLTAAASHDSVTLSWDDPGDDTVTGYVILRRIPAVDRRGHFDELVPDTASTATTYTDHTVSASTRYTYRIKAINEYGVSERSRWYHINTPAAPAATPAVTIAKGNSPDGQGDPDGAAGGAGTRANVNEPSNGDCPTETTTSCEVEVGGGPVRGVIAAPSRVEIEYLEQPDNPDSDVEIEIRYGFDTDWFRVDLEAGKIYRIEMMGATPASDDLTLRLPQIDAIYDPGGNPLSRLGPRDESSWHHLFWVTLHPQHDGTYYIAASGESFEAGTYELKVTDITP